MKALVCSQHGTVEDLNLETDWPEPECGPKEVIVDVKSAGLNFPDTLIIAGKYQIQPPMPFIPGAEAAGIVSEIGSEVSNVNVGDEVIFIGSHGGFCQKATVPAMMVVPKPPHTTFEQAAGIGMTYFTSYHALKQRANLQAGETVLVLGAAGGVGITAVELAKQMGATVIAAASTEEKLELTRKMGADHTINYTEESLKERIKEITGGKGVDVIYDPVGGDMAETALRSIAWNGRFLVVGFAAGDIPKIPLNLALLKGASIVGVFWGAFTQKETANHLQNIKELWGMFAQQKLSPIVTDVFDFADYEKAFNQLTERRARGKVIINIG
ncbi:MAG: NADPH:quinone oxidoreductase family protein [Pseudomonadota bacterium]